MATFSIEIWLALGAGAAIAVLATLHALASAARNEIHMHDLQNRVAHLRIDYYRRMRATGADRLGPGVIEAAPIEEVEPEPARQAA
ncbi:MAG: hypothetical protein ACF8R7_07670 [Phycisphaerales bacterium JB039]